jgi:hypothetical protein
MQRRGLRIVWVYPDLLSSYGDHGNVVILQRRAALRGIGVMTTRVTSDQPVPDDGDVYVVGGGEDLPQEAAIGRLRADGGLERAAAAGRVVFAVCAGYQMIGTEFAGAGGRAVAGLGLMDVRSHRAAGPRAVGEVVIAAAAMGLGDLTGFENHQGTTTVGPAARPLGRVVLGIGNGDGTEGAWQGHVLGTYMHGPALVRNPALADLLLGWALGGEPRPLTDPWLDRLHDERLASSRRREDQGRRGRVAARSAQR